MASVYHRLGEERQQDTLAGALVVVEVVDGILQEDVGLNDWIGFQFTMDGDEEKRPRRQGEDGHGGWVDVLVEGRATGDTIEINEGAIYDVACVVIDSHQHTSTRRKRSGVSEVEVLVHRSHLLLIYILQQEQISAYEIDLDVPNSQGEDTRSAFDLRLDDMPPD